MITGPRSHDRVRVDNLSIVYGTREVVRGVNLVADRGSFVAVLGPNGSGKTSFIKSLLGIVAPSTGSVDVYGGSPHTAEPGSIGYVPQVKTLERTFPAIALELVVSGLLGHWPARVSADSRATSREALERVGAGHLSGRQLSRLSGGELQRVYLARSLIRRPQLLLLDEPATGIDAAGTSDLYGVLETYQAATGATIFMVTHDWNVAYHHASHVLILNRDQVSYGPSADVLTEANLRRAFGHVGHDHAMFQKEIGHD